MNKAKQAAVVAIQAACRALEARDPLVNSEYLETMSIDPDPCAALRITVTALELAALAKQLELDVINDALALAQAALAECEAPTGP